MTWQYVGITALTWTPLLRNALTQVTGLRHSAIAHRSATCATVPMRTLPLLVLLALSGTVAAETYNDCILENMKGVGGDAAARLVRKACRDKVLPYVPAMCLPKPTNTEQGSLFDHIPNEACIEKCLNAGYWAKTFGDCKP